MTDISSAQASEYIDWGQENKFKVMTAVGECAGVIIDLVTTLLFDSEEKLGWAVEAMENKQFSDSIYHSYNVLINSAKAMLLGEDVKNNSQIAVIRDFDKLFVATGEFSFAEGTFEDHVLRINKNEPSETFAKSFLRDASAFLETIKSVRDKKVTDAV